MEKQKSNVGLYIIIVFLLILVFALGGYIVYDKFININDEPVIDEKEPENVLVNKIDNSKDFVYDALYQKNASANSYSTSFNTYSLKDINVPYININSTYATGANVEIRQVFDTAINAFNTGIVDNITYVDDCSYKNYINNNALSVILTLGIGSTDVVVPSYYTYNIDLKTGNQISFEELSNLAGFTNDVIDSAITNAIRNYVIEKLQGVAEENYPEGTNLDTYVQIAIDNFNNSKLENTLKYFLAEGEQLKIIVNVSLPVSSLTDVAIITVK